MPVAWAPALWLSSQLSQDVINNQSSVVGDAADGEVTTTSFV